MTAGRELLWAEHVHVYLCRLSSLLMFTEHVKYYNSVRLVKESRLALKSKGNGSRSGLSCG